jgi:hypothetical protein
MSKLAGLLTVVGWLLLTVAAGLVFVPLGVAVAGAGCLLVGRAVA